MASISSKQSASSKKVSTPVKLSRNAHSHRPKQSNLTEENNQKRVKSQDLIQNYFIVWIDSKLDETNEDFHSSITKLRQTVDVIEKFRDVDECLKYISKFTIEKAFLIVSGVVAEKIIPIAHRMKQIYAIYVFCRNKSKYEHWATKERPKIRGIYTDINQICASVRQAARECDNELVAITGEVEPTFLYTTLFKEIVLEINYDHITAITELANYARKQKAYETPEQQKIIDDFVQQYQGNTDNQPVRWYTAECFTYKMLNKALGTLDVNTLLKTAFYMKDLHQNIQQLHTKQLKDVKKPFPKTVYRGQTMTKTDFALKIRQGKLFSWNNFLSTSEDEQEAVNFIHRKLKNDRTKLGVLFNITIDPSVSSAPFARVAEYSDSPNEQEILFSTHTVFFVQEIEEIQRRNEKIQNVHLTLTNSTQNTQLAELTESIRKDIKRTGWERMGSLLWKLGNNDKAQEIYSLVLQKAENDDDRAYCYNQLGLVSSSNGNYQQALLHHQKSLQIRQESLPPTHPELATSYSNIGVLYNNMGDYSKALEFYEKSLEIDRTNLPPTHILLATSYNNIAAVYRNMGDYSKALEFYGQSLKIRQEALPPTHPDLATSYNNIAAVYRNMGDYLEALEFYKNSLKIKQEALPPIHPSLTTSYNNIGEVFSSMGDYSKALEFYEKSLEIDTKTLPPTHPLLATSYNNIAAVHDDMGDYSRALEFYEKALKIRQDVLPPKHPDLATSYNNIGTVYYAKGDYPKALQYIERALSIWQKSLPPTHPTIQTAKDNIASVKKKM